MYSIPCGLQRRACRAYRNRRRHRLEVAAILGELPRPKNPIELLVSFPIIEREPLFFWDFFVVFHFFAEILLRKKIDSENRTPDKIIFLALGVRREEREPV